MKFEKLHSIVRKIRMEQVTSTNIDSVEYDKDLEILTVKFLGGGTFEYENVPIEIYEDLLNADSIGSFFYWNIREFPELYPFREI